MKAAAAFCLSESFVPASQFAVKTRNKGLHMLFALNLNCT